MPRIIQDYTGFDEIEYFNNLAENYKYDTTRESESAGRGGELLQGEQTADNAGDTNIAESGQGGNVQGDVYSGGENATPQGNQQQIGSSEIPNNQIPGLKGYTTDEVLNLTKGHITDILGGDISIVDMRVIGSRSNGTNSENSDLDVLVEFDGDISEDAFFNAVNGEDALYIDGVRVDINPITKDKSGTIEQWMNRNAGYSKTEGGNAPGNSGVAVAPEENAQPVSEVQPTVDQTAVEKAKQKLRARAHEWMDKVGVPVRIVESLDEVTNKKARKVLEAEKNVTGWVDNNEVVIYLPNIKSASEIDATYIHEVVAHKGLKFLMGEKFDALCDSVWNSMSEEARVKYLRYIGAVDKNGNVIKNPTEKQMREAADEYMAFLAEGVNLSETDMSVWQKFVELVKKFIAENLGAKLTDKQIEALIKASYANLKKANVAKKTQMPMSEAEYAETRSAELMKENPAMDEVDAFNMAVDEYPAYMGALIESGELTEVYKKASVGEKVALNKMIQAAGFEISDVNTQDAKNEAKRVESKFNVGDAVSARFGDGSVVNGIIEVIDNGIVKVRGNDGLLYPVAENKIGNDVRMRVVEQEVYTAEEQQIIDKAKQDGTYMKAPNGEPTKLSPKQWAQVRTKKFKKWFGDWEKIFRIEKLKKSKPAEITGNEIQITSDHAQNKKNAVAFGKNFRGEQTNEDTGKKIVLTSSKKNGGLYEIVQHDYKDKEHILSIAAIPQIIKKSIYITTVANQDLSKHPDVVSYDYFVCGLRIGKEEYTVKAVVSNMKDGARYYDHKLTSIEKGRLIDLIEKASDTSVGISTRTLASNALSQVKDKRLISILQTNSSKIVDENGEPMVVYHRTPNEFTIFDPEMIGTSTDAGAFGSGFYLSPADFGSLYGKNLMPLFVNLKNPLMLNDANAFDTKEPFFGEDYSWGKEQAENFSTWVKNNGYDGVWYENNGRDEIVATEPNQMKSADAVTYDDNGNVIPLSERFDEEKEDIRFRKVFHGSGAKFDRFDHSYMGTGEGAQVYGWGTYVTEVEGIGRTYAGVGVTKLGSLQAKLGNIDSAISSLEKEAQRAEKDLTSDNETARRIAAYTLETANERRKALEEEKAAVEEEIKSYRNLYTVEIPDDNGGNYLHWDKPINRRVIDRIIKSLPKDIDVKFWVPNYLANASNTEKALWWMNEYNKRRPRSGEAFYNLLGATLGSDKAASEFLSDMGFVGISYPAQAMTGGRADGARNYVIFNEDDAQIEDRTMFRRANKNQEVFVSNAQRAVEGIKQEKATPEQWIAMIKKSGGLKAGEDKWMGLSEWLENSESKSLTKQEVLDFVNENAIKIEEVEYAQEQMLSPNSIVNLESTVKLALSRGESIEDGLNSWDDEFDDNMLEAYENGTIRIDEEGNVTTSENLAFPINETREHYTTDGLENKREIALVVPTIEPYNQSDEIHFGDAGDGRAVAWVRFGETTDSEGNRVLVIDEIQSKRHQEGREKGYRSNADKFLKDNGIEVVETDTHIEFYKNGEIDKSFAKALFNTDIEKAKNLYVAGYEKTAVPSAPFEKNWQELAMKRMLRLAAEEGFDKVAWTTGEQQAERYALSRSVADVVSEDNNIEVFENGVAVAKDIRITTNTGSAIDIKTEEDGTIHGGEYDGKNIGDVVGKELAAKLMNPGYVFLSGDGLRIGGEGMKGFYDKMLPSFVQKYTKKWGAKVGEVSMPELGENGMIMHSVDVTPEMQESVMEGQTMFRFIGKKGAANLDKAEEAATRLDNLNVAREMETAGKDAKTIKLATGWERGADGKWRYETEDAKVNREAQLFGLNDNKRYPVAGFIEKGRVDIDGTVRLDKLIDDEALFDAYPGLREYYVTFEEMEPGTVGSHNYDDKVIRFNRRESIDKLTSTLNHEIQHAVQHIEGFALGSNVERFADVRGAVLDSLNFMTNGDLLNGSAISDVQSLRDALNKKIPHTEMSVKEGYADNLQKVARKYGYENIDALVDDFTNMPSAFEQYRRTAGEVESRNVQERMGMTPEERRNSLAEETADVAKEDQIFLFENQGTSAMGTHVDNRMNEQEESTLFRKMAEKQSEDELALTADAVAALGEKIGVPVRVVTDAPEKRKKLKGWFENGEVVVALPNHVSMEDAVTTVLHEVVGHKGLRGVMGEAFDGFLDFVYENAATEMKRAIDYRFLSSIREGRAMTLRECTEEYIASLAERGFDGYSGVWNAIKQWLRDFFRRFANVNVSDGELRYMLWKSYNRLQRGPIAEIEDIAMEDKTNTGDRANRFREVANDGISNRYDQRVA